MSRKRTQYKRYKRGGMKKRKTEKRKTEKRDPDSGSMKTWWKYQKYHDKIPDYKITQYKKRYDYDKW
jgi:hypothetical protein